MHDAASPSVRSQKLTIPGKADRIERDAGHSASSSGIEAQGAVAVPDFTPLRNGSGPRTWPKKAEIYIVRTDGMSCSRETVRASGCLSFAHPSTQQQLLVWRERPKCVLVLKKLGDEQWDSYLRVLRYLGKEEDMRVVVEPHEYLKLSQQSDLNFVDTYNHDEAGRLHQHVDFVVCLGGDGTILHASSLFQRAIPPVVSFSAGSLGFLTNLSLQNVEDDLRAVIYGCEDLDQCSIEEEMRGVHITLRMRLECRIVRQNQSDNTPQELYEVLNEVVVDRGANPYLAKIECWERDTLITKVQADGVMLATPTGSTAYSVAAGGSMVHPNVPAILFTPICPHSLSFRPVVLPDYAELELRIPGDARCPAWVCFDGKQRQELQRGDAVRVRMSTNPVPTISKMDQTRDWFGALERCFGWNDRAEQKPLSYIDRTDGCS
ncbi:NAD kinase 2, chloroplastic [Coccomyxa sp. Obi]|nr:NAD kinase 2, chloroplastic [Coccomyxa sp. Obi]